MSTGHVALGAAAVALVVVVGLAWLRRAIARREPAPAALRAQVGDLLRLPGRLRRVAADPRTPRRARWLLIGLAVYVASPIDPIPDFLPGVGFLDELVIVPLVLSRVRRMVPPEVWREHFSPAPEKAFCTGVDGTAETRGKPS